MPTLTDPQETDAVSFVLIETSEEDKDEFAKEVSAECVEENENILAAVHWATVLADSSTIGDYTILAACRAKQQSNMDELINKISTLHSVVPTASAVHEKRYKNEKPDKHNGYP